VPSYQSHPTSLWPSGGHRQESLAPPSTSAPWLLLTITSPLQLFLTACPTTLPLGPPLLPNPALPPFITAEKWIHPHRTHRFGPQLKAVALDAEETCFLRSPPGEIRSPLQTPLGNSLLPVYLALQFPEDSPSQQPAPPLLTSEHIQIHLPGAHIQWLSNPPPLHPALRLLTPSHTPTPPEACSHLSWASTPLCTSQVLHKLSPLGLLSHLGTRAPASRLSCPGVPNELLFFSAFRAQAGA
jgi:hypothetical protein